MKDLECQLTLLIREALADLKIRFPESEGLYLELPANNRFGDLSSNIAMRLSKALSRPPAALGKDIAAALKERLGKSALSDYVKEVKVEGAGFVNFYLSDKYFYEELSEIIRCKADALRADLGKGKRVLVEFVSANPTGSLSVAHARQAAVGDSLAKILKFLGFNAESEYYLNDEGNQINILGQSVALRMKELEGEKIEFPEDHYQGDYIYDIAKEAKARKVPAGELGDFSANYILDIIKKELDDFGVAFDHWSSQKELRTSGKIERDLDALREKGFVFEQDGAHWLKSTAFGDDKDRVVIKSDGSYTYLAPDIAYHQEKYKRGFEWLVNLWGPDHHGYIPRLKASVQAFGKSADSLSVVIVQLATIFRDGKVVHMSTRKGQYITLREVLDEVGRDAARFFFAMRRTSSHLDFDLDVAKKQTSENPVYYVQYAHARIQSILRSAKVKFDPAADFSLLKEKEEMALIKKILQIKSVLNTCVATLDPYMLTVYLQELAESFHKFYDLHRVLTENDALTKSRLALIDASRIAIAQGLDLLGVSKPEKM